MVRLTPVVIFLSKLITMKMGAIVQCNSGGEQPLHGLYCAMAVTVHSSPGR